MFRFDRLSLINHASQYRESIKFKLSQRKKLKMTAYAMIPAMCGMAASWFRRLEAEEQQILNDESSKYTASEESRAEKMA